VRGWAVASKQVADVNEDVAVRAWAPVTVRVAWTLLAEGVALRPEVLHDARDHVWFHLDPATPTDEAVDRAERLVRVFVARARGRLLELPWPQDEAMALSPRWRRALFGAASSLSLWVLRRHYADGATLASLAERLKEEVLALEAAREGLREVLRRVAAEDGLPLDTWSEARLDALIHRLACMTEPGGPDLVAVADGLHPEWVQRCVTCGRAVSLVRQRVLPRSELVGPGAAARPRDEVRVLALQFGPAGARHRRALAKELPGRAFPVGEEHLVVAGDDLEEVKRVLELAAEVGAPRRDQIRGELMRGPGRWSRHGLVGPLVDRVPTALRAVSWGMVEGVGELPEALPEPPSARMAWAGVAVLAAVALVVAVLLAMPLSQSIAHPLEASATEGRGGLWLSFEVDDDAHVLVVRQLGGRLELVLDAADIVQKAAHASGDGGYRLHTKGEALLVASTSDPVLGAHGLVETAQVGARPLDALSKEIRTLHPTADVWVYER
jgi:hypothetical protein